MCSRVYRKVSAAGDGSGFFVVFFDPMNIDAVHRNERNRKILRGIYPIINIFPETDIDALLDWSVGLPEAGIKLVQVRAKRFDDQVLPGVLDEVVGHLAGAGLAVVLNDYVELAGITGANGLHLGLDDFPIFEARAILGPDAIIGATCRNHAEALLAIGQGATYVAAGCIFKSSTKTGIPLIGLEGLGEIVEHIDSEAPSRPGWGRKDNVPVCAIGGINLGNLKDVYDAGASMAAVISAIQDAEDPLAAAKELVDEWNRLDAA